MGHGMGIPKLGLRPPKSRENAEIALALPVPYRAIAAVVHFLKDLSAELRSHTAWFNILWRHGCGSIH